MTDTATYDTTITVYTYPTAATLDRIVRAAAKQAGHTGTVRILSLRPRSHDDSIRQYIDVACRVTTTPDDVAARAVDPFAGLDVPFTDH